MDDLALLRTFEPILRFTYGESFFPAPVEPYVRQASLWVRPPNGAARQLVARGALGLDRLGHFSDVPPGHALYLRYVARPLDGLEYQRWLHRRDRPRFQAVGRLSRVGLGPRLVDALFSLSLLLRGTVPGGTAAAAEQQYRASQASKPSYVYYGRATRSNGYLILHYLFFYAMNDWRSGFGGANDHEGDWEQIFVYLEESDGESPRPLWVAYASHDDQGDDLRRRWDDPDLSRVGNHPVVYVGAGSHACYVLAGEYLASVELKFMRPVLTGLHWVNRIWRDVLQQGDPERLVQTVETFVSVPFIDYARGDGVVIGPGQPAEWTPVVLDESEPWLGSYRGLWGFDSRDPLSGETAPAGPRFNRDGTVRSSWLSPLDWAGLGKVLPPRAATVALERHVYELEQERDAIDERLTEQRTRLHRAELELQALRPARHLRRLAERREAEVDQLQAEVATLQRSRIELRETLAACRQHLERLRQGDLGDPQAHLRRTQRPQTAQELRRSALADLWSALSVGLLLIALVAMLLTGLAGWFEALALSTAGFVIIDALLRRRIDRLLVDVTIVLALACGAILIYEFRFPLLVVIFLAFAGLIITDNVSELRRR